MVLVFRGSGASASDTDWSNMYIRTINELDVTAGNEALNKQIGGTFARTSAGTVTTYSNILYGPYYRYHWLLPNVSFAASSVTYIAFD